MDWYLEVMKKYAVFGGRARRKEYWYFFLSNILIAILLAIIDLLLGTFSHQTGLGLLGGLYALAMVIPGIAVSVRRLHDTGRSGWWLLIGFVPVLGGLVLLAFFVQDSQPGQNQYGPYPKLVEVRRITMATKRCPFCAEEIQEEAILCKHCHSHLLNTVPPTNRASGKESLPTEPTEPPEGGEKPLVHRQASTPPPSNFHYGVVLRLLFLVIGVCATWYLGTHYIVSAQSGMFVLDKDEFTLTDTFINLNSWTVLDVARHPLISAKIIAAGKGSLLPGGGLVGSVSQAVDKGAQVVAALVRQLGDETTGLGTPHGRTAALDAVKSIFMKRENTNGVRQIPLPVARAVFGGREVFIDREGLPAESIGDTDPVRKRPLLVGLTEEKTADDHTITRLRMIRYMELLKDLESGQEGYSRDLSEVDVSDPDDVKVILKDDPILIHLGIENYLSRFKVYLGNIKKLKQDFPDIESVDLRFKDQIVIKRQEHSNGANKGAQMVGSLAQQATEGANRLAAARGREAAVDAVLQPLGASDRLPLFSADFGSFKTDPGFSVGPFHGEDAVWVCQHPDCQGQQYHNQVITLQLPRGAQSIHVEFMLRNGYYKPTGLRIIDAATRTTLYEIENSVEEYFTSIDVPLQGSLRIALTTTGPLGDYAAFRPRRCWVQF